MKNEEIVAWFGGRFLIDVWVVPFWLLWYSVFRMNRKSLDREIQTIVKKLVLDYKPEKVVLFGSAARGEFRKGSDIDLLIVKESKKKRVFRIQEVFRTLRSLRRNIPLEPLVYTPSELANRLKLGDFFVERALEEGKVLYEKT